MKKTVFMCLLFCLVTIAPAQDQQNEKIQVTFPPSLIDIEYARDDMIITYADLEQMSQDELLRFIALISFDREMTRMYIVMTNEEFQMISHKLLPEYFK